MTKFNFSGIPVEVTDKRQAEKLVDLLKNKSYTQMALDNAAPGLMAALRQEFKTCTDIGARPQKFEVKDNTVRAEMTPDRRRLKHGVNIGNR